MQIFNVETKAGKPIQRGMTRIIPMVKTVQLFFPFLNWGLAWNRPAAVIVQTSDRERVLDIEDTTRRIQWTLWGIALFGLFFIKYLMGNEAR